MLPTVGRPRAAAVLSVAVPAAIAGLLVALLVRDSPDRLPTHGTPEELIAQAEAQEASAVGDPSGRFVEIGGDPPELRPVTAGGLRPAPPRRLSIPAAGVDAPIHSVAAPRGKMEVPDITRVGWFEGGARPGEPGRSVLIGHRDGRHNGAVFAGVRSITPGTPIEVTDARGVAHRYRAVGTAQVPKDRFPSDSVYGRSRRPVLVLVTCGGRYSPESGYRDNVIVYARAA